MISELGIRSVCLPPTLHRLCCSRCHGCYFGLSTPGVSFSICTEFHCAIIVMLLRAPLSHPVACPPGQACLSASRGGGMKQPTSLSSPATHTPLLLPGDSTVWCRQWQLPFHLPSFQLPDSIQPLTYIKIIYLKIPNIT